MVKSMRRHWSDVGDCTHCLTPSRWQSLAAMLMSQFIDKYMVGSNIWWNMLLQNFKTCERQDLSVMPSQQSHNAMTSSWRPPNEIATSFWRHNDVIFASCVRWDCWDISQVSEFLTALLQRCVSNLNLGVGLTVMGHLDKYILWLCWWSRCVSLIVQWSWDQLWINVHKAKWKKGNYWM